jgi:hypothetical protein
MRSLALAPALAVIAFIGCMPPKVGSIGPAGFEQQLFEYRVGYGDPAHSSFLGPDWQLDNFSSTSGFMAPKKGPDYEAVRELDEDDNGTITPNERTPEPIYDLRFINAHDNGVIWFKAHPLDPRRSKIDLDVALNNYVDGLSGAALYAQSTLFSVEHEKVRHYQSFLASSQPTKLGPHDAIAAEIEIAELEKLKLDPKARSAKLKLALARFTYYQPVDYQRNNTEKVWRQVLHNGVYCYERPALLVVGYYNTASKFDDHVKDFDRALAQLSFESTPSPAGATSAAPAASAGKGAP